MVRLPHVLAPPNPVIYLQIHTPQLAFADRILLNKIDLVDEAELASVEKRIRVRITSLLESCIHEARLWCMDSFLPTRASRFAHTPGQACKHEGDSGFRLILNPLSPDLYK